MAARPGRVTRRARELALVSIRHRLNAEETGGAAQLYRGQGRVGTDVTSGRRPRDRYRLIAAHNSASDLRSIPLVEDGFAEAEGNNFRRF